MTSLKSLVLRTSGTNCELETARALDRAGAPADVASFRQLSSQLGSLAQYRILVFAGGFSHGDDLAAGRVWGSELRGVRRELDAFVADGGLILGVCNGFQVLVESGLFQPERAPQERSIALYANASNHYECRWVTLEAGPSQCGWLEAGWRFPVPVAHAEGRFTCLDDATFGELEAAGQLVLRYVTPEGGKPSYPENPNGSAGDVAGICDPSGRVVGLMPHPERNLDPWNHPEWTRLGERSEGEGLRFYQELVAAARAGHAVAGAGS
jgi:phosphoribosylformylglycinamidine synthase